MAMTELYIDQGHYNHALDINAQLQNNEKKNVYLSNSFATDYYTM